MATTETTVRGGVCPIKSMYVREAPSKVVLAMPSTPVPSPAAALTEGPRAADSASGNGPADGDDDVDDETATTATPSDPQPQRLRGMNKGAERAHVFVAGSGDKPVFEGERNFFFGPTLSRVKIALKLDKQQQQAGGGQQPKRGRDGAPGSHHAAPPPTTTAAADALSSAPIADVTSAVPLTSSSSAAPGELAALWVVPSRDDEPPAVRRQRLFSNKLILAPLTTVGNLPYRRICKSFGADVTLSEMSLAYNLNHTQKSEWSLLRRHESEDIFGIQIATKNEWEAATVAKLLKASEFSYDYVDVNCGCPVELICQQGCGCGLWEKKGRMKGVMENLTRYQDQPVTVKCRIGRDEADPQLHKHIGEYESWGASAVTIHGRSRKQRYTKLANWEYINDCANRTQLPVIGNGDIMSYEDVAERRAQFPALSSHMIARGALIKPWVFTEIKERRTWDISSHERLEMLKKFAAFGLSHWGADAKGVHTTRRFMCEWLSFLCRYVPVGLLERLPQRINDRPPYYVGRDDLETLMASDSVEDWIRSTELLLGPCGPDFKFTPKHKSNSYASNLSGLTVSGAEVASAAAIDLVGEVEG